MNGTNEVATGTASGKAILLGEHAVVYGVQALALGLGESARAEVGGQRYGSGGLEVKDPQGPWTLTPTDDLSLAWAQLRRSVLGETSVGARVRLKLPSRAGLGSSAAMGVALARATLRYAGEDASRQRVLQLAMDWEKVFHGNPSGVDVAVAEAGGVISFVRGTLPETLQVPEGLTICVGDTGTRSSTKQMVSLASKKLGDGVVGAKPLLDAFSRVVLAGRVALGAGDWRALGRAMNENNELLRQVGVVTSRSDVLCEKAIQLGALGAKVTGAGGGGCVIALAPGCEQQVVAAWQQLAGRWGKHVAAPIVAKL